MGTLLAMVLGMSMMAGCGHTKTSHAVAQVAPIAWYEMVITEPPSQRGCEVKANTTTVPPQRPTVKNRSRAVTQPRTIARHKPKSWVPERVPIRPYYNPSAGYFVR